MLLKPTSVTCWLSPPVPLLSLPSRQLGTADIRERKVAGDVTPTIMYVRKLQLDAECSPMYPAAGSLLLCGFIPRAWGVTESLQPRRVWLAFVRPSEHFANWRFESVVRGHFQDRSRPLRLPRPTSGSGSWPARRKEGRNGLKRRFYVLRGDKELIPLGIRVLLHNFAT